MPITEGARAQKLVEILEYAAEHDGIKVKNIPYVSNQLNMDTEKLYSLINLSWEIHLLQLNEQKKVYNITEKAERFLKGFYRATEKLEAGVGKTKTETGVVTEADLVKTRD